MASFAVVFRVKYLVKDKCDLSDSAQTGNLSNVIQVKPWKRLYCRYSINILQSRQCLNLCRDLQDLQQFVFSTTYPHPENM